MTINITQEEFARIEVAAKLTNTSINDFVKNAILESTNKNLANISHQQYSLNVSIVAEHKCLHDNCRLCNGTGIKLDGCICVHNIACNCKKCSIR
jgi:hypothetical protein